MFTKIDLLAIAIRLTTEDRHLLQKFDGVWYAYVHDGVFGSEGGPVIVDPSTGALKRFATPELAYQACLDALAGREMTADQYRVLRQRR
jgi:hypothetical protein